MEPVLSVCIISVHALSCGHCRGCLHSLESPLFAEGWLRQFPRAQKGAVFLFSHSPVPFLELQLLAGPLLLSSTSFSCSGTRPSPLTKKRNKQAKEIKLSRRFSSFSVVHEKNSSSKVYTKTLGRNEYKKSKPTLNLIRSHIHENNFETFRRCIRNTTFRLCDTAYKNR